MVTLRHLAPHVAAAVLSLLLATGTIAPAKETLRVDCARQLGTIRPLHGVNGGPLVEGETIDLSSYWRELAIPITRLHDCEFPFPDLVDMHAVFPRSEANPRFAGSFRFGLTDRFLDAVVQTNSAVVYRLGESIEHCRQKQYVHPPADCDRWAQACVGIIRHYNDGWANGVHYGIRYWEIWNEPENRPAMWTGTDDDYYRLYAAAAKTIKAEFPHVNVGGPSVGATGELVQDRLQATPFLEGFVSMCREQQAPLDFFSWHTYTNDPYLYVRKAQAVRAWLNERGFHATEIHLNEWNYLPDNDWTPMLTPARTEDRGRWYDRVGGAEGAAFTACVLAYLQDSPVDVANYYSGDTNPFALFDRYGAPRKSFYAMQAFRRLLDTPQRVETAGWRAGETAACAGTCRDGTRVTILVSHLGNTDDILSLDVAHLPWTTSTAWTVSCVDATHNLEPISTGEHPAGSLTLPCPLPAPGLLLVELRPSPPASQR